MVARNASELARVSTAFADAGYQVIPSHGNFILTKIGNAEQATALSKYFESKGIMVRDVNAYGLPEYLRISIGTEEENTILLEALSHFSPANQKRA